MEEWKTNVIKILSDNIEFCKYYSLEHEKKSLYYKTIYNSINTITTITMFINFILSTLVSGNLIEHQGAIITIAILSAIIGSNNLFSKYCFDPAERMTQHNECKNKYKELISSIELELNFSNNNQETMEEFTKQICKKMLSIETDPNTPSIHSKQYLKEKRNLQKQIIDKSLSHSHTAELELEDGNSDVENNVGKQIELPDNTIDFDQLIRNVGLVGLNEDEKRDFDILYNNSKLEFQKARFKRTNND